MVIEGVDGGNASNVYNRLVAEEEVEGKKYFIMRYYKEKKENILRLI